MGVQWNEMEAVSLPPGRNRLRSWAALACFVLIIAGCDRQSDIKVYRVVKAPLEQPATGGGGSMPTNAPSPNSPHGMAPIATGSTAAPSGWEPQQLSEMRQASFLVKGDKGAVVDISLVSLGTSASNVLDNVNRWLGQLGQAPIDSDKLAQMSEHLTTLMGDVTVVDLAGLPAGADPAKDGRIIAAMVGGDSGTMFFKMRGNAELAEAQKPEFKKWVTAVCAAQKVATQKDDLSMPLNEPRPQIEYKTPQGWTEVPPSSMRYASFNAAGPNGSKIDISVVTFPGDGGPDSDNVNRWRQQIGLPPISDTQVQELVVPLNGDAEFSTLDMTSGDSRVVAAWTRRDGRSWFFKMSGPAPSLEAEKSKFFDFIRSIHFHS
jgi:hypothetical protein